MPACAIIWDYDGTLVDSRHRNLSVNRSIVQRLTGRSWPEFRALRSILEYDAAVARCTNWRDFYEREFGIDGDTVESAGQLWTEAQRVDATPVEPFAGVPDTLDALAHVPHAIVSQNAREIIVKTLEPMGLGGRFDPIVGYREVAPGRQKPAPDGLLECLARLIPEGPGAAFYVGDHPTDVQGVVEARREIKGRRRGLEIWSIAALYGGESTSGWPEAPDYLARRPGDIVDIVNDSSSRVSAAGRSGEPEGVA